ncbi:MAG: double-strand break repair helicase AddA [Sulfitobacter sp.]
MSAHPEMPEMNDATRDQVTAARPDASTWLGANAGSGKTRVLTDRVARLLLDGVDPQNILCLTYTKAAASEMQNRLFKRLGKWAMLDDDALRGSLRELGVAGELPDSRLNRARTLFASAIEAPGGLKIQTIHSFCAGILRRFPLEAGVSPQFTEIEDRAAELLRVELVDEMAEGPSGALVAQLARHYTEEDFAGLTREITGHREGFAQAKEWGDILEMFGQPATLDDETILRDVFDHGDAEMLDRVAKIMAKGSSTDQKMALRLRDLGALDLRALAVLEDLVLFKSGAKAGEAKLGSFPTKATQKLVGADMPPLDDLMQRVAEAREKRVALGAARRSFALHGFAQAFLPRYEAEKQRRGWLDFDDLILRTRALLSDKAVAAWVLYRIDGGIDHILVDEAQDTSPRQWEVIERLTDEFGTGQGARANEDRTLFVVGDKKQSIYSFQGADPREFDHKQDSFEARITGAGGFFQRRSLAYSFRSSAAILRVVDCCFTDYAEAGFGKSEEHIPFKQDLPGRVDLWPLVEPTESEEDGDWYEPIDRPSPRHHAIVLAHQVADKIKELTDGSHSIPDEHPQSGAPIRRAITPGDFLILVQRRSALFAEIIRACKAAGLPIAGADRLKVGAELAVRDLAALLSFLATPEDDLSLATALRSPLFGWSEQALFDLTHRRSEPHVWQALRGQEARYPDTIAMIRDLRAQVDFLRPYDLIERILTRHDGRRKLLGRLGDEAEDGIDALLSQALAFERAAVPSLTGFLVWMETDELEIKRQIDSASDQIRVMTVHGSKGLEAPIVILPDCGARPLRIRDQVIDQFGVPVWKMSEGDQPGPMIEALEARKEVELNERQRLLYVAMTRAEKWLMVAASGKLPKDGSSWYQMVQQGMIHAGAAAPQDAPDMLRVAHGDWDGLPLETVPKPPQSKATLDPLFEQAFTKMPPRGGTISPSDLEGAKALPGDMGEEKDAALAYGTYVHGLLEKLPLHRPEDHEALAGVLGAALGPDVQIAGLAEARAVLANPALASLFAPETLAEVAVSAQLDFGRIHGVIDRLVVTPTLVLAVDFKTNRVVPGQVEACPEGIIRQMAAYALGLAQLYPDHEVQTAILWTATAQLMVLPHDIVTISLQAPPDLDGRRVGS